MVKFFGSFERDPVKGSRKLIQPNKTRPRREVRVVRNDLQVCASLRPLQHDHPSVTRNPRRDQVLDLRSTNHHASDLVQSRVHMLHERQLRLYSEDRNGVSAGVEDWTCVAIGHVDVRVGERQRGFREEDLCRVPVCLRRWIGRQDAETGDDG